MKKYDLNFKTVELNERSEVSRDSNRISWNRIPDSVKQDIEKQVSEDIFGQCTIWFNGKQIVESVSKGCTSVPLITNILSVKDNEDFDFTVIAYNIGRGALSRLWYEQRIRKLTDEEESIDGKATLWIPGAMSTRVL